MRNYFDPEMSIVMFDAENVVTEASGLVQKAQEDYFNKSTGTDRISQENTVAANNILNFTN